MPLCFQTFADVRAVLDCTEVAVQKPKCLCCRIRTYRLVMNSCEFKSGLCLVVRNSAGSRIGVPYTISAGQVPRSEMILERKPNKTVGSFSVH